MIRFKHRANTTIDLFRYNAVEIDVKGYDSNIVLGHDWTVIGPTFKSYLSYCTENHVLAVNIKQSGIHEEVIRLVKQSKVKEFFLFDFTFPDLFECSKKYPEHTAVRISEYEDFRQYEKFTYDWIWIDVFNNHENYDQTLHFSDKKMVIVSPELHGSDYRYVNLVQGCYGICTDEI